MQDEKEGEVIRATQFLNSFIKNKIKSGIWMRKGLPEFDGKSPVDLIYGDRLCDVIQYIQCHFSEKPK